MARLTHSRLGAAAAAALFAVVVIAYWAWHSPSGAPAGIGATDAKADAPNVAPREPNSVDLSDSQLSSVKVEPVEERDFPVEKQAVGSIDFNEDMAVQVFTPYQGRIIALFAQIGDDVKKGKTLFTIDSPDLLQAESTLIAAAGVLELDSKNLDRLRDLFSTRAVSQRDVEQATSDQQTAEGNLRAARDAVRLFGKTDADIDRIVTQRSADSTLVVSSPINGRITARNAAPGLFVQPGNAPGPYAVADISTMWMLANVAESDSPAFRLGQPVQVRLDAFPGRTFDGRVTTIGAIVDPNTRRVLLRSEIGDPQQDRKSVV
jgi:cobalt-zinc-cadmium efflux system membrane fusion protein